MKWGTLALGVAMLFIGATVAVEARSDLQRQATVTYQRDQALKILIARSQARGQDLKSQLQALHQTLQSGQPVTRDVLAKTEAAYKKAQAAAGETPVTGRGIRLQLSDAPIATGQGGNQAQYLIHNTDLLRLVNDLDAGGARAVSIDGQRIVAGTPIQCSGPVITINGVRSAPPVTVLAVGNQKALAAAVEDPQGIVAALRMSDLPVTVQVLSSVTVPAYTAG